MFCKQGPFTVIVNKGYIQFFILMNVLLFFFIIINPYVYQLCIRPFLLKKKPNKNLVLRGLDGHGRF